MRRDVLAAWVAVAVLTAGGCSSGQQETRASASPSAAVHLPASLSPRPIPGCVPGCNGPGIVHPGSVAQGPYKTAWFFGGQMVIDLAEPWSVHEDSTGELSLTLDASPQNTLLFWEDVYPIAHGKRVPGVPLTVNGFLRWLRQSPQLHMSAPRGGRIGSSLPATVVDVSVSPKAVNEDPGCPSTRCVLWLDFPQWDDDWGIAEPQVQRFYLSDVTYGGRHHLFVAVIYPDDPKDLADFASHADQVLGSVQVPARSG